MLALQSIIHGWLLETLFVGIFFLVHCDNRMKKTIQTYFVAISTLSNFSNSIFIGEKKNRTCPLSMSLAARKKQHIHQVSNVNHIDGDISSTNDPSNERNIIIWPILWHTEKKNKYKVSCWLLITFEWNWTKKSNRSKKKFPFFCFSIELCVWDPARCFTV